MSKASKRYREASKAVDPERQYSLSEAVKIMQSAPKTKFDETVEVSTFLGIDPRQADQSLRGAFSLPHGLGKKVRVIAFVDEALVEKAKEAGAVEAGGKELADRIKNDQWFDFDVVVAEPKMMRVVGALGRVLGPKGLMPSPKAGTVVPDPIKAIGEFSAGKQEYKNDAGGNVHFIAGKISFAEKALVENLEAFLQHIQSIKPSTVKGHYLRGISVSTTMGPGINIAVQG